MKKHVALVVAIQVLSGGISLATAFLLTAPFFGLGYLSFIAEESLALTAAIGVWSLALGLVGALAAVPYFLAAWGMMTGQNWGRIVAIFLGVLSLFAFPLGTVLGIYVLWVLTDDEVTELYVGTPVDKLDAIRNRYAPTDAEPANISSSRMPLVAAGFGALALAAVPLGYWYTLPAPTSDAPDGSETAAVETREEPATLGTSEVPIPEDAAVEEERPPPAPQTRWTYKDDGGVIRFVPKLEQVPPAYRPRAMEIPL